MVLPWKGCASREELVSRQCRMRLVNSPMMVTPLGRSYAYGSREVMHVVVEGSGWSGWISHASHCRPCHAALGGGVEVE